jgi:hypothetical protein
MKETEDIQMIEGTLCIEHKVEKFKRELFESSLYITLTLAVICVGIFSLFARASGLPWLWAVIVGQGIFITSSVYIFLRWASQVSSNIAGLMMYRGEDLKRMGQYFGTQNQINEVQGERIDKVIDAFPKA